MKPTWREVKKYLRTTNWLNPANMLCGADILDEKLDEVLNCLLNNCVLTEHGFYRLQGGNDVWFLKQLLDRGASLWFKGADERSSSIAALLDCVRYRNGLFPLSEFSPYICCPVFYEYGDPEISFDSRRLALLCWLAAGKIPRSDLHMPPNCPKDSVSSSELIESFSPSSSEECTSLFIGRKLTVS